VRAGVWLRDVHTGKRTQERRGSATLRPTDFNTQHDANIQSGFFADFKDDPPSCGMIASEARRQAISS